MKDISRKMIVRPTSKGEVRILSHCSPAAIRCFGFTGQFGMHAHYKSLYTRRESLEKIAQMKDTNVALALDGEDIIGFGVLAPPEETERWAKLKPLLWEVKAIEVSRQWRVSGVAGGIIQTMLSAPEIESRIVYMVGYSWTWDLDGTGCTAQQYRGILIRLFEPHGFKEYETNEPNICLKAENVLLGRIGRNVSRDQQNSFKWLRFDISPEFPRE